MEAGQTTGPFPAHHPAPDPFAILIYLSGSTFATRSPAIRRIPWIREFGVYYVLRNMRTLHVRTAPVSCALWHFIAGPKPV